MKKALITGITGQDGSYLAELLLEKGYEVHGITRRASISNTARIDHLIAKNAVTLHDGDLSDSSSLIRIIGLVQPDEIYNLAAQSHVQVSFDVPEYSGDVDAIGVLRILEAIRILGLTKKTKFYQASTSELYGKVEEVPQKETTPFHPYSPGYGSPPECAARLWRPHLRNIPAHRTTPAHGTVPPDYRFHPAAPDR